MGVDVSEEREQQPAEKAKSAPSGAIGQAPAAPASFVGQIQESLRTGLREMEWRQVLLYGVIAGLLMSLSFVQPSLGLNIVIGLVPVGTGLLLARRVKGHYWLHGFMTGVVGTVVGAISFASLIFLTPLGPALVAAPSQTGGPQTLLGIYAQFVGLTAISLIAFVTFGASMAGRTEARNRAVRDEIASRGGQLERAGAIREASDIRGLSLPQFGSYVKNVFTKQGFKFKDYRFIDKDKHLDLWLEYEDEPWHLRLSVADKVSNGTIESLAQEMKREGCGKGVVLASTEFIPSAAKSAKGRPIVLIDGEKLFEIAEK